MGVIARLLARLVGGSLAESMLGDLSEERTRRASRSPGTARLWFCREVAALVLVVAAHRLWVGVRNTLGGSGGGRTRWLIDVRDAARSLRLRRGSSLAVILVLALGIGLTSTMFALADPYVLRPLPYANPDTLLSITVHSDGLTSGASVPTVEEWRHRSDLFVDIAAIGESHLDRLRLSDRTTFLFTQEVSANFFSVLGLSGPQGDGWREDTMDASSVALTDRAGTSLPTELIRPGALLSIEAGGGLRVAAVLSGFQYPDPGFAQTRQGLQPFRPGTVITVPEWDAAGRPRTPASGWLIARVQRGVTPKQVESALSTSLPSGSRLSVDAEPLASHITRANRVLAAGALGAALFVLIICAGNAGNLLLARRTFRAREIATRAALGASRTDLRRLWLIELAIMTGLSIVSGLIVASSGLAILVRVVPESYVTLGVPAIDNRVVTFALLAGALTMTLGLSLATIRDRHDPSMLFGRVLVDGGRRIATFRNLSVALQSALSMILAIGSALLVQSYWHVVRQQTGLDGDAVAVTAMYPSNLEGRAARDVIAVTSDRLRRVPGVDAVAVADGNVVNGVLQTSVRVKFSMEGGEADAQLRSVSDGYFAVAGMDMVLGRSFAAGSDVPELVVNDAFARRYWPDGSAIGRTTSAGMIVGIVRDAFEQRYDRRPVPTIYNRLETRLNGASTLLPNQLSSGVTYLLRARNVSASSETAIRRALFDIQPDVVVVELDTLGHKLSNTVRNRTFATLILSLFGIAGATVTITGLVGIVTTVVARRTREIAIRLAIGAQRRNIRWLITRDVLTAAGAGGAAGLFAGRWLSTWLGSFVYGVDAGNWMTVLAAAGVMLAIMTVAALVPTSRAVNLPPTEALRVE